MTRKLFVPMALALPVFKGSLDETGKKLAGTFSQNGVEGTFQTVKAEK